MSVDASAVASTLGIQPLFKDLRGGAAKFLPQGIALFVQGETGVSYSSEKWLASSAGETGARYGYRSPAYLAMRKLLPPQGGGVGSIPVYILPLQDHVAGVAAAGSIEPSGTTTKQTSYRVRVAGILGQAFTLPLGAVNVTDACRKVRESIEHTLGMPVVASNTYGTVTSQAGGGNAGNGTVTSLSVTGSPLPGNYVLTCTAEDGDGGTFQLTDPNGAIVSNAVDVSGDPQDVGGIQFTLADGANDFEIGDTFTLTVPATDVAVTAAWKGSSGNDILIEIVAAEAVGAVFAITQPTGGLNNPSVESALGLIGEQWLSLGLNQFEVEDTTTLDLYQAFGEGRWDSLVHKPMVVFTGNTAVTVADATAVSSQRRTDRVNSLLVAPGSPNLPFLVAAEQLARIAAVANNNPAVDYVRQTTSIVAGNDEHQWDFVKRDQANKLGCSTVLVEDRVVYVGDVKTFWRPEGEDPPAYADVVDIVKLQNCIFNVRLRFNTQEWAAAPLIPDDEPTRNVAARKPKHAKAELSDVTDALADEAIVVSREETKKSIVANISSSNPKRLDARVTFRLSGNTKIKSLTLEFGFFYGQAPLAA